VPQLVITDFIPQLVWLTISFLALYLLLSRVALPRIAAVLADRDRFIEDDLARAEQLKFEADRALKNYAAALAAARTEVQRLHRAAAAEISALATTREQAFAAELGARTRNAEDGIASAKHQALSQLPQIATEVAGTALQRLTGERPAPERVGAAVAAALKGA
jgi:F-type H+-transporting ATPase subunit b